MRRGHLPRGTVFGRRGASGAVGFKELDLSTSENFLESILIQAPNSTRLTLLTIAIPYQNFVTHTINNGVLMIASHNKHVPLYVTYNKGPISDRRCVAEIAKRKTSLILG